MAVATGEDIDAFCPSCQAVKPHVVVAVKGTRAAKTECKVCTSVHPYRKNPPDTKAKKKGQYDDAMEGKDPSKAVPYKITKKFNADDVIKHKSFGVGLVTRVISDRKMEVMFEDCTKLLIQGR